MSGAPLSHAEPTPDDWVLDSLFEMSIEELARLEVKSASLTRTDKRLTPAAVTQINQSDIRLSGARTLNELLQIYVPGLQLIKHSFVQSHLGQRGIMGDKDLKYILTVNGRVMNQRTQAGVVSERDLMLLSDIHEVEVIRGPGSAVQGLGAVSMVINIVTQNGESFQGEEARIRMHEGQDRYSLELKHGMKFGDQDSASLYLYGGISYVRGASKDEAPFIFPRTFTSVDGVDVEAGEPAETKYNREGAVYRDLAPIKLHAEFEWEGFGAWMRYTRGGEQYASRARHVAQSPIGNGAVFEVGISETGYQQFTLNLDYEDVISEQWRNEYSLSFDTMDFKRYQWTRPNENSRSEAHREDEYFTRALSHWTPSKTFGLSTGFEISHEEFGLETRGYPDHSASSTVYRIPGSMPQWETLTLSWLFETQWKISNKWTSFVGWRVDKNTYTDYLFSPRFTWAYAVNDQDAFKMMLTRSNRINNAQELRDAYEENGVEESDPEKLDNVELRYEHMNMKGWSGAISSYYQVLDAIGHSSRQNQTIPVGEQEQWGTEFELSYFSDATRISFSHQYTKLINFKLSDENSSSFISSADNGFGNDLDNWSNHISKVDAYYQLNPSVKVHGNLQYLWGFQGTKDYLEFRNSTRDEDARFSDPGYDDFAKESVFLNLGLEYKRGERYTVNLNGYHLLGLFNEDLNKVNFIGGYGDYRNTAPSIGLDLTMKF
ncbi:MAG: TonB-dependent receptor [Agarilytica sp.]